MPSLILAHASHKPCDPRPSEARAYFRFHVPPTAIRAHSALLIFSQFHKFTLETSRWWGRFSSSWRRSGRRRKKYKIQGLKTKGIISGVSLETETFSLVKIKLFFSHPFEFFLIFIFFEKSKRQKNFKSVQFRLKSVFWRIISISRSLSFVLWRRTTRKLRENIFLNI